MTALTRPRARYRRSPTGIAVAVAVVVSLLSFRARAELSPEPEARVLLVRPLESPDDDSVELRETIESYLNDLSSEIQLVRGELPPDDLGGARASVSRLAAAHGADHVIWTRPGAEGEVRVYVALVRGATVVVRTLGLDEARSPARRSTIAAFVRAVVGTSLFTEPLPEVEPPPGEEAPAGEASATPAPEPAEGGVGPSSGWSLGLVAGWGMRWLSTPGPHHQALSVGLSAHGLEWLGLRLGGRVGLVVDPTGDGSAIWRAALNPSLGLEHVVGWLRLGLLAGLDLEWMWGEVELGAGRAAAPLRHLGLGVSARSFLEVQPWRGLIVHVAVEGVVRPSRTRFLLRGDPVASSGWLEITLELGLGWRFE